MYLTLRLKSECGHGQGWYGTLATSLELKQLGQQPRTDAENTIEFDKIALNQLEDVSILIYHLYFHYIFERAASAFHLLTNMTRKSKKDHQHTKERAIPTCKEAHRSRNTGSQRRRRERAKNPPSVTFLLPNPSLPLPGVNNN
ncbi:hypothetical protein GQ53DRAFT_471523 [Thozetella sp. PMI_491]|nr:hypothetical protein GQ53DRAFT_471523 [Thozetella sp. PMI_491]